MTFQMIYCTEIPFLFLFENNVLGFECIINLVFPVLFVISALLYIWC
jgi:hypothetical protein